MSDTNATECTMLEIKSFYYSVWSWPLPGAEFLPKIPVLSHRQLLLQIHDNFCNEKLWKNAECMKWPLPRTRLTLNPSRFRYISNAPSSAASTSVDFFFFSSMSDIHKYSSHQHHCTLASNNNSTGCLSGCCAVVAHCPVKPGTEQVQAWVSRV